MQCRVLYQRTTRNIWRENWIKETCISCGSWRLSKPWTCSGQLNILSNLGLPDELATLQKSDPCPRVYLAMSTGSSHFREFWTIYETRLFLHVQENRVLSAIIFRLFYILACMLCSCCIVLSVQYFLLQKLSHMRFGSFYCPLIMIGDYSRAGCWFIYFLLRVCIMCLSVLTEKREWC